MTKILVATTKPFAPAAVQGIQKIVKEAGYEFALLEKYNNEQELLNAVSDATALIVRSDKITSKVLDAAKELKIIVRAGAGYDNVDTQAAKEKGIVVMNTPGQNSNAVAELAFGLMIFIARKSFSGSAGSELRGKKIGIHAYGNIGKIVAQIARGFKMISYAYDPFVSKEDIQKDGVIPTDSEEELYSTCDYISLHIPATDATKCSINFNLLNKMPKNGVLVNTARKEVMCEASLMKMFKERPDFKYASDIAPDNASEMTEEYKDRCFFTPKKMGAQTAEANINAGLAAANQIIGYLKKGDTTFQVNK